MDRPMDEREQLRQLRDFATLDERVKNMIDRFDRFERVNGESQNSIQRQLTEMQKQFSGLAQGWGEHMHQSTERDRRITNLETEHKEFVRSVDARLVVLGDKLDTRVEDLRDEDDKRLSALESFRIKVLAFATIGAIIAQGLWDIASNYLGNNLHLGGH